MAKVFRFKVPSEADLDGLEALWRSTLGAVKVEREASRLTVTNEAGAVVRYVVSKEQHA